MKRSFITLVFAVTVLAGCVSMSSDESQSGLEVHVTAPEGVDVHLARVYVGDLFVGNASKDLPSLHLLPGRHVIKVELAGMKTYQQEIVILGGHNHQYLNVNLEKK